MPNTTSPVFPGCDDWSLEPTLEEEYPDLEFYRGVPVFRAGDRVLVDDAYETVVTGIRHDIIDEWLDNRDCSPRYIVDNVYYTVIEDPEDGETFTEITYSLELLESFKPKGKSGLTKFLERHSQ